MNISNVNISKLKKAGISPKNYKRVLNPLDAEFHFESVKSIVKVERAIDVLPSHIYKKLLDAHKTYDFRLNMCHYNSLKASQFLFKYGIRIVDGLIISKCNDIQCSHSFLEYNGHYFDITMDFAISKYNFSIKDFGYYADRMFNCQERLVISHAVGYLLTNDLDKPLYSSLINNIDEQIRALKIGDFNEIYFLNDKGKLEYLKRSFVAA